MHLISLSWNKKWEERWSVDLQCVPTFLPRHYLSSFDLMWAFSFRCIPRGKKLKIKIFSPNFRFLNMKYPFHLKYFTALLILANVPLSWSITTKQGYNQLIKKFLLRCLLLTWFQKIPERQHNYISHNHVT